MNDGIGGYDSMNEEEDDFSGDDASELRQASKPAKVAKPIKEENKGTLPLPSRKSQANVKMGKPQLSVGIHL